MTRKHFKLIAESINRTRFVSETLEKNKMKREAKIKSLRLLTMDLAGVLKTTNTRFDGDKFIEACGFGT